MKTMKEETLYFGVFNNNQLVGISSCEINSAQDNVEMTDFAIMTEYRGNQLARHLLKKMEIAMEAMGIKTSYTIARSTSFPMNATFSSAGYEYSGTLWNNTQISGDIESMNVWYKPIEV
jgi:putative beta-lysine N-acetyltransferase